MWTFVQQIDKPERLHSDDIMHSLNGHASYSGQCHSLIIQNRRFESQFGRAFDPTKVLEKKA